jgi:hypothetical protein
MAGTADFTTNTGQGTPDGSIVGPYAPVGDYATAPDAVWQERADMGASPEIAAPALLTAAASADTTQAAVDALVAAVNETRADLRDIADALRTAGILAV